MKRQEKDGEKELISPEIPSHGAILEKPQLLDEWPRSGLQYIQSCPHPSNSEEMIIKYRVIEKNSIVLDISDMEGNLIVTLVDRVQDVGNNEVIWSGKDANGGSVPAGAYICRLIVGKKTFVNIIYFKCSSTGL